MLRPPAGYVTAVVWIFSGFDWSRGSLPPRPSITDFLYYLNLKYFVLSTKYASRYCICLYFVFLLKLFTRTAREGATKSSRRP